ncbi:DNA primase catalytic core domain protein [Methanofollis liminatans DSM 4140]|uniref:DNA primase catalytic core domain protein n=1 Tax=Methanofollis liminatans DSM 4140 TaxID=28892 RepID=J1L0X6_9EURY|nr:toprim domain-containing protein [Methanofollis liminatans]EJG06657.1 DNA primase catalytic core domain protein [Methanofollis liminatans DSM 4140]
MTEWNALMEDVCRFYEQHLTDEHRAFLLTRYGFQPWFVERSRLGYAPADSSTALLLHLMDRGYSGEEIIASGTVGRWTKGGKTGVGDLFRGRRVFPYLDGDGTPEYFTGRQTDETPAYGDREPAKYVKQIVTETGPKEPIFGRWSVIDGEPLIITEGISDALAVLQDCRPCISPVTTSFKRVRIDEAAAYCRRAGAVYVIMDSEESGAGPKGATKTAHALLAHGIERVYIGTLPRPDGIEKVDLNDYLRGGGDLAPILAEAIPAGEHPGVQEERRQEILAGCASLRSAVSQERWKRSGKKKGNTDDIDDLKRRMPSLSAYTGIAPGKRGPHPVYGSTHGDNFAVSRDGETWTSFHGGNETGKSGNLFKLIALEQRFLSDEGQPLRGEAFKQTIAYCRERWT